MDADNKHIAKRKSTDGRRLIKLNRQERRALKRREICEKACVMFLDLDNIYTYKDIAEELGLTVTNLKRLIKTQEFDDAYSSLLPDIGHDPRYKAARATIADLLPNAIRELKFLLNDPDTAAGVKLRAIEKVMELNGIDEPTVQSERNEIVNFLLENNVNIEEMKITVPPEYLAAIKEPTIDAEFEEIDPRLIK
jgi:predicted transcriptional regulator